jgi:hypothetical protein
MERTDWLDEGFDSGQARFLMVTSIMHHRFSSPLWGGDEVRKLHAELAEIELAAAQSATAHARAKPPVGRSSAENVGVGTPGLSFRRRRSTPETELVGASGTERRVTSGTTTKIGQSTLRSLVAYDH